VSARDKTLTALNRHIQMLERDNFDALLKTAGLEGEVQVAGAVPKKGSGIDNEMGGHLKRAIPQGYQYDPKALKPLARMLWAMSVSLGHAMTAHRQFAKVKSSTISPDGLIGGRGYVMAIKDVRKTLYDACENLSAISDTIHDELNAPHWKPKLAQLEKDDVEDVERLVGEAEQNMDNPEGEAKDDMSEAEEEGKRVDLDGDGKGEPSSRVPDGKDLADNHTDQENPDPTSKLKMASAGSMQDRILARFRDSRMANSSVSPETLPGPRVEDLDRTNDLDLWSLNDKGPREYDYTSEWDNEVRSPTADSSLPSDSTPTDADSFGLGPGEGGGSEGYSTVDSDGKGVYGPHAELPHPPGTPPQGSDDSTAMVELDVGRSNRMSNAWKTNTTSLPQDVLRPPARSDYYPKGSGSVPTPPDASYDHHMDVQPGLGERHEQSQPYIKWDHTTHNMRPDPIYQREVEGPYVKQSQEED
jgi:hypothetical protein